MQVDCYEKCCNVMQEDGENGRTTSKAVVCRIPWTFNDCYSLCSTCDGVCNITLETIIPYSAAACMLPSNLANTVLLDCKQRWL